MSRPERYTSDPVDPKILGDALTLPTSGLVAKSRFLKAAMTERLSSWNQKDISLRGTPSDKLIHLYEVWGKGDFGIILSGNVIVDPENLEAPGNAIISKPYETPERVEAFTKMAKAGKAGGSLFYLQISHGGRQTSASVNPHPVSASDVQLMVGGGKAFAKPTALTSEGVKETIDHYAYAAEFAYKTGYDGIELHGAHGYLLAQFLSNTTNKRTDEYGGSLENRARIVYDIVSEIKRRVTDPKFSIGIKINCIEYQEGGFQPEDCREVCQTLDEMGIDFIELSAGTYEDFRMYWAEGTPEGLQKRDAYFIEQAEIVRSGIKKAKLYLTGGFRTAGAMVHAVEAGIVDGIGLGRPVCEEPHLPKMLISGQVSAARNSLIDGPNFGLHGAIGGFQLLQLARGDETTLNTTDEEAVERFKVKFNEVLAKKAELAKEGIEEVIYPDM